MALITYMARQDMHNLKAVQKAVRQFPLSYDLSSVITGQVQYTQAVIHSALTFDLYDPAVPGTMVKVPSSHDGSVC
jgi:hypothetical protein